MNYLKTENFDVIIPEKAKTLLINHFLRECFGGGTVQKEPHQYSNEQYQSVIEEVISSKSDEFESTADSINWLSAEQKDILISFIKTRVSNLVNNDFTISIKDYLSNYLITWVFHEYLRAHGTGNDY